MLVGIPEQLNRSAQVVVGCWPIPQPVVHLSQLVLNSCGKIGSLGKPSRALVGPERF
jgi:hypothetical protein